MIVDTTLSPSTYDTSFKKIYFKNYLDLRKQFTDWIDSNGKKKDFNWWLSVPASRNFNLSKLYHYYCLIESIKKINKTTIKKLIVDDTNIKEIVSNQLRCNFSVIVKNEFKESFLLNLYQTIKHCTFFFTIFLISRILRSKKLIDGKDYVLIDTFLEGNDLNTNRYYGEEFMRIVKQKNNVFFVPSFYIGMGLLNVIKKLFGCNSSDVYLIKESYLKFSDIRKSFSVIKKNRNLKKFYLKLNNIDYSKIIHKELRSYKNLTGQILGWQNYLFFKNLKLNNIKLKKTINWFENQSQDKGWNLGVRTFFPKTHNFGYQGFTYFPQYMCLNPSNFENNMKIVPDTILSIGKRFENTKKEFCEKIKVKTVPALNFQYLHKKKKKNFKKIKNSVLIILSGFLNDDVNLIKWLIEANLDKKNYKIYIKEHPILKIDKIQEKIKNFPKNFLISKNNFTESINMCQILICTGATSALIELIIQGKYCIIPRINPFDGVSLKKLKMNKNFKIIEKPGELIKFLKFKKCKKYNINQFFNKLTKENLKVFF